MPSLPLLLLLLITLLLLLLTLLLQIWEAGRAGQGDDRRIAVCTVLSKLLFLFDGTLLQEVAAVLREQRPEEASEEGVALAKDAVLQAFRSVFACCSRASYNYIHCVRFLNTVCTAVVVSMVAHCAAACFMMLCRCRILSVHTVLHRRSCRQSLGSTTQ
jgi:hypothetical protein